MVDNVLISVPKFEVRHAAFFTRFIFSRHCSWTCFCFLMQMILNAGSTLLNEIFLGNSCCSMAIRVAVLSLSLLLPWLRFRFQVPAAAATLVTPASAVHWASSRRGGLMEDLGRGVILSKMHTFSRMNFVDEKRPHTNPGELWGGQRGGSYRLADQSWPHGMVWT